MIGVHSGSQDPEVIPNSPLDRYDKMGNAPESQEHVADGNAFLDHLLEPLRLSVVFSGEIVRAEVLDMIAMLSIMPRSSKRPPSLLDHPIQPLGPARYQLLQIVVVGHTEHLGNKALEKALDRGLVVSQEVCVLFQDQRLKGGNWPLLWLPADRGRPTGS